MENTEHEILQKLNKIQIDIEFIKNNMVDADCILTEAEKEDLEEARKEYAESKTISLEKLKDEMKKCHSR